VNEVVLTYIRALVGLLRKIRESRSK